MSKIYVNQTPQMVILPLKNAAMKRLYQGDTIDLAGREHLVEGGASPGIVPLDSLDADEVDRLREIKEARDTGVDLAYKEYAQNRAKNTKATAKKRPRGVSKLQFALKNPPSNEAQGGHGSGGAEAVSGEQSAQE